MRAQKPEAGVQKAILQTLAIKRVWHMRLNTGAVMATYKGKTRFVKFGKPGMGDILAALPGPRFWWIEVKAEKGRQSEAQAEFQREVEAEGHVYTLARSVDDVLAVYETFSGTPRARR